MKKKLINIIIIFIIIQGIFAVTNYSKASSEKVNLSVSSTIGNIGEEVSIDINLNNSSNFAAANLVLNYDTEVLEYVSYTKGEVLEAGTMSIVKNNSDTGKIAIGYVADPSSEDATVQAGNILKVVFKIKSNFEQETELELECTSLKDEDGIDIETTITNGKIEKTADNDGNEGSEGNKADGKNEEDKEKEDTPNDIPYAGLSEKTIFIMIFLILITISVVLYKKDKYMSGIR